MATPKLTPIQVEQVSGLVAQYISVQRQTFSPRALPLTAAHRVVMNGFFPPTVLEIARVLVLSGVRVENPPFYPMLVSMGFSNLPDFSRMAAITFCDVVVCHDSLTQGLLFHELVHVEQYRQVGIPRFAELYVRGFLTGGSYDGIPLEMNAYSLEERFQRQPAQRFSVEAEVSRLIRENTV